MTALRSDGHTPGHQSLLVELPETGPVILAGDCCYWQRSIDEEIPPGVVWDPTRAMHSIKRLKTLARLTGGRIFPSHDPAFWDARADQGARRLPVAKESPMGVLDGIKVLELARVPPAELPGMFLADMGADVLKIETPPETPRTPTTKRRAAFAYVNRNKRSLALNMKAPEGQAIFKKLAATADVIVEGFRPGVMKRLGADYETHLGHRTRASSTARSPASARTARTATTRPTTATTSRWPAC